MIVVDSSSIISLAMNCLCSLFRMFETEFAVTPKVYDEIVSRPSTNRRFALESIRIKRLFEDKIIDIVQPKGILQDEILEAANRIYKIRGNYLKIIHSAEADAIALAHELKAKALLIDERTTRLLMEDPDALRELLSHRNMAEVYIDKANLKKLHEIMPSLPIIRSAELVTIAYEKGYLTKLHGVTDKSVLDAALSALKFSGCAITWDEIEECMKAVM